MAEIGAASGVRHVQRPLAVFLVDAAHLTNEPYVQRGWCRTGHQGTVPTPTRRQSATLFGAWHLRPQRCYGKRAARGTSKLFLECLPRRHPRFPETLRILLLDHATIHQSRAVKRFLTSHDWGVREHLAPYAPEYHPLERFWQWLKVKGYGATAFATIDDVITRVRQIVWHDHEGRLTSTSHFDFTDDQRLL